MPQTTPILSLPARLWLFLLGTVLFLARAFFVIGGGRLLFLG